MLIVALLFATFYSEYLNFYELVNNCTNIRIAVWLDVQKLEGHIFERQKKKAENISSCFQTDAVWQESLAD